MRKIAISCFLLLILPFAGRTFAQNEPQTQAVSMAQAPELPARYYHLDFVVQEVGQSGKPINSRTYSCTVSTVRNERDSVRIGSSVPMASGFSGNGNQIVSSLVNTQFQYQHIGVNFDISDVREVGGKLAMNLGAEVDSIGPPTHVAGPNSLVAPLTRQNSWRTPVLIPIGKSTVVFTSDDLDSKDGMQVVVTATLLH